MRTTPLILANSGLFFYLFVGNPVQGSPHRVRRIVNGERVPFNEFPFKVGMHIPIEGDDPTKANLCGGSLLTPYHVLTAAHCFHGKSHEALKRTVVYLNTTRLDFTQPGAIVRGIIRWVTHEKFVPKTKDYDVAILTLNEAVKGVPLVKLPSSSKPLFEGKIATVIGWGRTWQEGDVSEHILKTTMWIISNEECSERNPANPKDGSNICSVSPFWPRDGGLANDSCKGDSGGPVIVDGVQVGIVSHVLRNTPCGSADSMSIDARISFFLDWIEANSHGLLSDNRIKKSKKIQL